jgi:AraC-like DNA-binding protein
MTKQALTEVPGVARLFELGHRESMVFPDLLGSLPAQIHSAGFQSENASRCNATAGNLGSQGLAAIRYTLSGRGRLRYFDQEILVEPGQALLLYFPFDHPYWVQAGEEWEFFYVTLAGREVIRCIREVADTIGPVVTLAANSPTLARAAGACADTLEDKIGSPYQGSACAHAMLMELLGECCPSVQVSPRRWPVVPAFVTEVEEFCRQNYAQPIGVTDMAGVVKMSRFHFTRLFQKAWGLSPGRYLGLVRLEKAMQLVREGGFTIKELAHQCGFGTANYFSKVFRKHYGVRPGRVKVDGFLFRTPPHVTMVNERARDSAWHDHRTRGWPQ